ncbi:MAG: mechanosensitive ion channel family protein [Lachnospiraceae bacterium]|nr:mechanosensitive ion channel family protein [Lachnospiraceae bacterium]
MADTITTTIISNLKDGAFKSWLESFLPSALSFFWSVILALIIWFVGIWLIKVVNRIVTRALNRKKAEIGAIQFLNGLVRALGYLIIGVVILNLFGITTTSVAAAVASIFVTAGLALQGSLSNFAGGVLILVLHPFKVGDYIIEDTKGNEGTVTEISLFYTKLKTIQNEIVVVPNGNLANTSLTNITYMNKRMINKAFPISYEDDIRTAKDIVRKVATDIPTRIVDDEIKVFVSDLGDSAVDICVRVYVDMDTYWDTYWQFLEDVKYALDENGITIPYNQMEVTMKKDA